MRDTPSRLASLDAFRGFTIAAMVLVNNPGDWSHLYGPLAHAHWNGWTFTDCIFPFFLFIAGVSMALSLGRQVAAGASRPALLARLAKRAALIFLVGFLLNLVPYFHVDRVRIPGVLQRIALCTLLAAPIVLWCGWRLQLAAIGALLGLYSILMLLVPVPGIGAGVLEPGMDVGAWVDRSLLGGHLWVQSKTWDPEGLVSTLPATCNLLAGVLAGRWLACGVARAEQTVWLLLAGLSCCWLGAILDTILMPINKSLWTPSFACMTTGWGLVAFAAFFWLLDATPHAALRARAGRWATPLVIYGMNALCVFAFSGFAAKMLGYVKFAREDGGVQSLGAMLYAPLAALPIGAVNASLLHAVLFDAFMFLLAWIMWRNKWFVKV
jgi:predicted acyltransferase